MSAIPVHYYNDRGHPDPAGLAFRAVHPVENGADSRIVADDWIRWAASWGGGSIRVAAHDHNNRGVADTGWRRFDDGLDHWKVPDAARKIYIEGRRDNPQVVIGLAHYPLAK